MNDYENIEYKKESGFARNAKKLFFMFAFFYTALTILGKLAVSYGFLLKNSMDNLVYGVVISAILSLIYVIFTINDKR